MGNSTQKESSSEAAGGSGGYSAEAPPASPEARSSTIKTTTAKEGGFTHAAFIIDNPGKIEDFYEYDKKKAVGEGSYGQVFVGTNKSTKFVRAIKSISKASMKTAEKRQKMKIEIDIMKMMDHPNIIKLYESFEDTQNLCLVMEMCTGGELFDRIIDLGSFSEAQAATVMKQILAAILYMHKSYICHRDLKPENFLFANKENIEVSALKIIDFGLSAQYTDEQSQNMGLKTKAGTPYYVAPEVLKGAYNEMSDEWSCGVIMYILLCGEPPFSGDSDADVLKAVKTGKLQFPRESWSQISEDAKDLIKSLLVREVDQRCKAGKALDTEWIKEKAPRANAAPLQKALVDNLASFADIHKTNKLKKAALHIIAGRLGDEDIKALKETFASLDANGDGTLTPQELKEGLEKVNLQDLHIDMSLEQLMSEVDSDGSGCIDYSEFLAATLDRRTYAQRNVCWAAFRVFDRNGDGQISRQELEQVLGDKTVHDTFGSEAVKSIMEETDTNGDGFIDFEEFMQMMQK